MVKESISPLERFRGPRSRSFLCVGCVLACLSLAKKMSRSTGLGQVAGVVPVHNGGERRMPDEAPVESTEAIASESLPMPKTLKCDRRASSGDLYQPL